jgi:hypothetical protein
MYITLHSNHLFVSRPSWGKTCGNLRFRSVISMRITKFVKKKAPNPPAHGLKYEILAFIRTKNVEKIEIL